MQTSKARNGLSEAPQKTSPRTPKSTRATKSGDADPDSSSSKHTPTKSPIDKSSKVAERRSPRSPATEKRRPSKLAELEAQLSQLQDDLKKTKDQLTASESLKKQAQLEAEDIKKQLEAITAKLEDSQNQLKEFSAAEESRLQELRAISQDRDRAWQSELEAIQKQHSVDSAALASAMNEIHWLKLQLETESEEAEIELQNLKQDMEKLKVKLDNSERAEAEAEAKVVETQQNLEVAKATVETLRVEGSKLLELFRESISELEESKARVSLLEETMNKLQNDRLNAGNSLPLGSLESEVHQLRSAFQAAEKKYEEEQVRITSHIQSAYEVADQIKCESQAKESELESALNNAKSELCELKARLLDKETELQAIADMNEELKAKLENTQVNQMESKLKADLMDKENELQCISEENEQLKLEMSKRETDNIKLYESLIAGMELAKAESELESALNNVKSELCELKARLLDKETELQAIADMNEELKAKLENTQVNQMESKLKADLMDKENELQCISEENEQLKLEMSKRETDNIKPYESLIAGMELAKAESELESALNNAKSELCELKARLLDKETELQAISGMNEELKAKLENTQVNQMDSKLKADLMDKENELQCISEENEQLKLEMSKRETDNIKLYESAIAGMELAKAKEKEALLKLEQATEEAEAAKVVNAEMDAELRRLRVQSDQWRKAAEAAANVLTTNNERFVERTGSMDAEYQSVAGKLMHSPFSDDLDDDSPKKKNGGVLRKFGLWKKNSK